MEELRVPKRRVPVDVVLPGGVAQNVFVFLSEAAPGHDGPERLADLLNGTDPFIPAQVANGGGMTFLHRISIAVARVAPEFDLEAGEAVSPDTEHEVEITLVDGTRVQGRVGYSLPPERARLVDFLNLCEPFFRVVEPDAVALVGRAHVARVGFASR